MVIPAQPNHMPPPEENDLHPRWYLMELQLYLREQREIYVFIYHNQQQAEIILEIPMFDTTLLSMKFIVSSIAKTVKQA